MKLGTRLTLYFSVIIILVISGFGYFHIVTRRDILIRKMEVEVVSIGQGLKYSLEEISIIRERDYVQNLIDFVDHQEKTRGVLVYYRGNDLVLRSKSMPEGIEPYRELILTVMKENQPRREFGQLEDSPVFTYVFPLHNRKGRAVGGVAILQHMSFMEKEIRKAKTTIFLIILALIGGTEALLLFVTRRWITRPISQLVEGIQQMARGHLDTRINLKTRDEISALARAFNQMAVDLKKAQDKMIQEAQAKLELERNLRHSEKLATIGQLASELAHEIGTPLNIIGGRAELTKRKLGDQEGALRNLNTIIQQTERITRIIQQLLGSVRKRKPEQMDLALPALLETILDLLGQQLEQQGIQVMKEIPDGLPAVKGDPDQLQQVFLNLILNAIQAMPQGGRLNLAASPKWIAGPQKEKQLLHLEVSVKDSGTGMDGEVIQRIFSPFFTTKHLGTGLGLTVSQGIVEDHGGWIEVKSDSGQGSTFRVYLPCAVEETKNG